MVNFGNMMKQAQQLQKKMAESQENPNVVEEEEQFPGVPPALSSIKRFLDQCDDKANQKLFFHCTPPLIIIILYDNNIVCVLYMRHTYIRTITTQ